MTADGRACGHPLPPNAGVASSRRRAEGLNAAVARAARTGRLLSAVAFDINYFEAADDGRVAGDAVMRAAAGALAEAVRLGDIVRRVGGEEFAILLPYSTRLSPGRWRSVSSPRACGRE